MTTIKEAIRLAVAEVFPNVLFEKNPSDEYLVKAIRGLKTAYTLLNDQHIALRTAFDEMLFDQYKRSREYELEDLLRRWIAARDNSDNVEDLIDQTNKVLLEK